jgi:hypothetical protein
MPPLILVKAIVRKTILKGFAILRISSGLASRGLE